MHHYHKHKRRSFAWREHISPYHVVVSEVMLQQTQTDRVAPKFDLFIQTLPDFAALAMAPFETVLRLWKGLGYNRRALYLQTIAQRVMTVYGGTLPDNPSVLQALPGIGKATARSIVAFAFNKPTVFIETNIRSVFIYFFFRNQAAVHDSDIEPLVAKALDQNNPREWYYALMDYGVMLKRTVGNISTASAHYAKQSTFIGSDRQIRGMILQRLLEAGPTTELEIQASICPDSQRAEKIVNGLCKDKLIKRHKELLILS